MRFEQAFSRPDLLGFYVKERLNQLHHLIRYRRGHAMIIYLLSALFGQWILDRYTSWRINRTGTPFHRIQVGNHEMVLSLTDSGISRTLFVYGIHEERPAAMFEAFVRKAANVVDEPVVIDIGANIGYYVLREAAAVGPNGRVLATEPVEATRELLACNVAVNDYEKIINIDPYAIGKESGTRSFYCSPATNRSRFTHESTETGTDRVPVKTLDEYARTKGVEPGAVTAVRMDVEGFELEILQGMDAVLSGTGPFVMYIEVHPGILGNDHDRLLSLLADADLEILAVESGIVIGGPFETAPDASTYRELRSVKRAYALMVGRELS